MPTFNWVFENQPIASGILIQPSRYRRSECNLLADKKGPQQEDPGSCQVIYLNYSLFFKDHTCFLGLNDDRRKKKS